MEKEEVIYYLKNQKLDKELWADAKKIRQGLIELQNERDQIKEDMYYSLQTAIRMTDMPTGKGNHSDLNDIIEKTRKQIDNAEKDYLSLYDQVMQQIEDYRRVHIAVQTLQPLEKTIIDLLYSQNYTYKAVENELNIDHKDLFYAKVRAIDNLTERVNSSLTNEQLALLKNTARLIIKKPKTKKKQLSGQVTFMEWLNQEKGEEE